MRIVLIFNGGLSEVPVISNLKIASISFIVTLVISAIFLAWQIVNPTTLQIISDSKSRTLDCVESSYVWPIILYTIEMIILFANGYVSFKGRNIKNDVYGESKTIAATTYITSVLLLLYMLLLQKILPMAITSQINNAVHIICTLLGSLILLNWKVYNYFSGRENNIVIKKPESGLESSGDSSGGFMAQGNIKKLKDGSKTSKIEVFMIEGKRLGVYGMMHSETELLSVSIVKGEKFVGIMQEKSMDSWGVNLRNIKSLAEIFKTSNNGSSDISSAILNVRGISFYFTGRLDLLNDFERALSECILTSGEKSENAAKKSEENAVVQVVKSSSE